MAELVTWLCRSPRRLVTVLGGTLLVVVVVGSTVLRGGGAHPAGSAAGARPAAPATSVAAVPDATPFVTAAVRFVAQWGHAAAGESAAHWQARVDPLATPDLAAALRQTDLASLPGGGPSGRPSVRYVAQSSAMIAVPLTTGETVLVTVVNSAGSWRVSDVEPDVGDYGDVGSTGASATS